MFRCAFCREKIGAVRSLFVIVPTTRLATRRRVNAATGISVCAAVEIVASPSSHGAEQCGAAIGIMPFADMTVQHSIAQCGSAAMTIRATRKPLRACLQRATIVFRGMEFTACMMVTKC